MVRHYIHHNLLTSSFIEISENLPVVVDRPPTHPHTPVVRCLDQVDQVLLGTEMFVQFGQVILPVTVVTIWQIDVRRWTFSSSRNECSKKQKLHVHNVCDIYKREKILYLVMDEKWRGWSEEMETWPVVNDRWYPYGIESHALNIVQLFHHTLPCSSAVFIQICACWQVIVVSCETIRQCLASYQFLALYFHLDPHLTWYIVLLFQSLVEAERHAPVKRTRMTSSCCGLIFRNAEVFCWPRNAKFLNVKFPGSYRAVSVTFYFRQISAMLWRVQIIYDVHEMSDRFMVDIYDIIMVGDSYFYSSQIFSNISHFL